MRWYVIPLSKVHIADHLDFFFGALQLGCTLRTTSSEFASEQLHQSFYPLLAGEVFSEDVGGINLTADLPEVNGPCPHFFLHP